jgi:GAF domain-containing protein
MPEALHTPLPLGADEQTKAAHYASVLTGLRAVLEGEASWVAAMATVASVLHHAFAYFNWTVSPEVALVGHTHVRAFTGNCTPLPPHTPQGFYCVWPSGREEELVVGPYQGTIGCLRIAFSRGVCGAAARTRQTQLVPDVHAFAGHIACASR